MWDSDRKCGTVRDGDRECRTVTSEGGIVLDSTSKCDMTMTNYGKFLILLMRAGPMEDPDFK